MSERNKSGSDSRSINVLEREHPIDSTAAEETGEHGEQSEDETKSYEYKVRSSIIKIYNDTVPRDETDTNREREMENVKETDENNEDHIKDQKTERRIEAREDSQKEIQGAEVKLNENMDDLIESTERQQHTKQEHFSDIENITEQAKVTEKAIESEQVQMQAGNINEEQTEQTEQPEQREEPNQRKRKITILDEFKIVDPSTLTMETSRKRVPGKLIDRLWEPLDLQTLESIDRLLNIALTLTIERYGNTAGSGKFTKKMTETQKAIAKTWLNLSDSKSFRSRLEVTKVPAPSSMASNKSNEISDILSYDQILRRKTFLETYLNAELKQLSDLQKHYQDMEVVYQSDLEYLDEFRKTTSSQTKQINKDISNTRESLGLDARDGSSDHVKLTSKADSRSLFNPDEDDGTKELLQSLHSHLQSISSNTEQVGSLNDKLELVYNILDML